MFKIFLLLSLIAVIACNTDSKNSSAATTNSDSASVKGGFTWADDEEKEFLADCVESAKANVGDTIAFKQCNCVLKQLKQNFPTLDSANASADSAQLAMYATNCK